MWNLVWVFDFTMALRNPIRAPTHCVMLPYHACVWLVAACTTLYVTALKYYE